MGRILVLLFARLLAASSAAPTTVLHNRRERFHRIHSRGGVVRRLAVVAVVGLVAALTGSCEYALPDETTTTDETTTETAWVEVRYLGSYDIEEVWLLTTVGETTDRKLVSDDLIRSDAKLPTDPEGVVPERDVSLHLELEATSPDSATSPRTYALEYIKEKVYFVEPQYYEEPWYTGTFEAGVNHLGDDWALVKETMFIFGNAPAEISQQSGWRFEQVYAGPTGELYLYRVAEPGPVFEPDAGPVLLQDAVDDGYGLYNFVDFGLDPPANTCPLDDPDLAAFDKNPEIPDVAERWAPVIYQDIDADNYTADFITRVDFDGNLLGEDNASNRDRKEVRGAVYYSLVRGARHDFIGYFFYHAEDTSGIFDGGGHEHDVEGIVVSYNRCTRHLDALLANQHGSYASYVAPDNPSLRPPVDRRGVKLTDGQPDDEGFYAPGRMFTLHDQQTYDALAVGVEANTHAVWGRWDSNCVIGPTGHPDGCDPDEHGGDGLIYHYDNFAEEPQPPYPQYPAWPIVSYELIDIAGLWDLAHQPETCGQADPNRSPAEPPPSFLFACHDDPVPWDTLNSEGEDAGNLPWSWGPSAVLDHVCDNDAPNMLLHPAEVFAGFFEHAAGYFVHWYLDNPYADSSSCT